MVLQLPPLECLEDAHCQEHQICKWPEDECQDRKFPTTIPFSIHSMIELYKSYLKCISNTLPQIQFTGVNCEWGEWAIGECSPKCGSGTRINTRIKLVEESNGGDCFGNPIKSTQCTEDNCPGSYT